MPELVPAQDNFYRSFYFSSAGPEIIGEYGPNAQSLLDIILSEATEYVMYFDIVLLGEEGNKQFIITEDEYDRWAEQCIKNKSISAVKELNLTSSGEGYVIELNFVDNVGGLFEYHQYRVARNGTIELLEEKSLGHCGFAI